MANHAPTDKTQYDFPNSPHVRRAIQLGQKTLCRTTIQPDSNAKIVDAFDSYWSDGGVDCENCLRILESKKIND